MKINIFMLLISLAIASLAGYGFYAANSGTEYVLLQCLGSGISLFMTLGGLLALGSKDGGTSVNVKITSAVFFIIVLIEQIIFSVMNTLPKAPYIVTTGIILLVYAVIVYGIVKALSSK